MMKSLFGGAILGVLAIATGANAAVVTANYSGVMTYTAAEATGAPWGYDAWGNYVVGVFLLLEALQRPVVQEQQDKRKGYQHGFCHKA